MSNIEELVGRQIMLGELRRRVEQRGPGPLGEGHQKEDYRPCLVVSRQCGSGGTSLAQGISERLKWQVFDREIVEEVARSAHVRRQLIDSVDERVRSGWSEFCRKFAEGEGIGRETYLYHLRQVILALGHHGNAIILGRGANYILPAHSTVRVHLIASVQLRALRVATRENIPLNKARHRVGQIDAERAAFIHEAFGKDVNSPEDYDLELNTDELSIESAAEIVLAKLHSKLGVPLETVPCGK